MTDNTEPAPTGTRLALIEAGFRHFGREGFAGTSTRVLAAEARTNVASIAYHFGGKEGLRAACGAEVGRRIGSVIAGLATPATMPTDAESAAAQLRAILRGMIAYLIGGGQSGDMIPFMMREVAEGGPTLDSLYETAMKPTHRRLCQLWATATGGDPESDEVRLSVFGMLGQVIYLRIGMPLISRRMGWPGQGPEAAAAVTRTLLANLDLLLSGQGDQP